MNFLEAQELKAQKHRQMAEQHRRCAEQHIELARQAEDVVARIRVAAELFYEEGIA